MQWRKIQIYYFCPYFKYYLFVIVQKRQTPISEDTKQRTEKTVWFNEIISFPCWTYVKNVESKSFDKRFSFWQRKRSLRLCDPECKRRSVDVVWAKCGCKFAKTWNSNPPPQRRYTTNPKLQHSQSWRPRWPPEMYNIET